MIWTGNISDTRPQAHGRPVAKRGLASPHRGVLAASFAPTGSSYSTAVMAASDDWILTQYAYDKLGQLDSVTDNKGIVTKYVYDDAGRRTHVIENYLDREGETDWSTFPDVPANRNPDVNRITKTVYNALGQTDKLIAVDPYTDGNTVDNQETHYIYSSELTDPTTVCDVPRGDLLVAVIYPDSDDTISSGSLSDGTDTVYDRVEKTYYANGARKTSKDQRGVVHTYTYDDLGRLTDDAVTTITSGVDDAVRRINRTYDANGRLSKTTSYSDTAGSTVVNEVLYGYDDTKFGIRDESIQNHAGVATAGDPTVQYGDQIIGSTAINFRAESLTYPNSRVVEYGYGTTGGIDDRLNRVREITDDAATPAAFARYHYAGTGMLTKLEYPQVTDASSNALSLSYGSSTDSGGGYGRLDRFGRITNLKWQFGTSGKTLFDISHGYDRSSNRLYADRGIYKSHSHHYAYDGLDRLETYEAGKTSYDGASDPDGIASHWLGREQEWTFDQVGNQLAVKDFGLANWYQGKFNLANEYDSQASDSLRTRAAAKPYRVVDSFSSDTSANWDKPGSGDSFTIASGVLKFTSLMADTFDSQTEDEARGIVLIGEDLGPNQALAYLKFPSLSDGDYAGIVFGYKSANDYWMLVYEQAGGSSYRKLYHVENGVKTQKASSSTSFSAGNWYWLYGYAKRKSITMPDYEFPDGFPSGRVGLVTNLAYVEFSSFHLPDDALWADTLGRWNNNGHCYVPDSGDYADSLLVRGDWASSLNPILLKNIRLDKFRMTFSLEKDSSDPGIKVVFNAKDQDEYHYVKVYHKTASQGSGTAPQGYTIVDGKVMVGVSGTRDANNIPTVTATDRLWVRVTCDGTNVTVKCLVDNTSAPTENDWSNQSACFSSSNFSIDGGYVGFCSNGETYVDDLTVDGYVSSSWVTQIVENFTLTSSLAAQKIEHDAAGNMTFDGLRSYTYDAWNRMTGVARAYRDDSGTLQTTSTIAALSYDGLDRRIVKQITNSGDWNETFHYYYDSSYRIIEVRNSDSQVLNQYVWGNRYVDDLVQIGLNQDPQNASTGDYTENLCERFFYSLQDANFNVLGTVTAAGRLVERYEYTPYGQRTVYSHGWMLYDTDDDGDVDQDDIDLAFDDYTGSGTGGAEASRADFNGDGDVDNADIGSVTVHAGTSLPGADPNVTYPRLGSFRGRDSNDNLQMHTLNPFGHQGLLHDREFGLIYNRARYLDPRFGRFTQNDPLGYVDGMSSYSYEQNDPTISTDASGMLSFHWKKIGDNKYKALKDGADLTQLSQMVVEDDNSWVCLWPIETPDEPKSRILWYRKKQAACDDIYDISNLTADKGPNVEGIFVAKEKGREEAVWYSGYTTIFDTGAAIGQHLKRVSGEGETPIDSFTLFSHGGYRMTLNDGDGRKFTYGHLVQGRGNSFDRAKQKKGPMRCWFRPGATIRFVGCYTEGTARVWASKILRSGSSSFNRDTAYAYGTTKWLQVRKGRGGRLLSLVEYALMKNQWNHENITTPFVQYNQMFNQDGWSKFPARGAR